MKSSLNCKSKFLIMNTRPLTLADIFLEVLEQWFSDDSQKAYVRKVKTLMNVPECAEFLSISLMNAMGHPTRIAVSTIDKAVNCLTHFYEDNIKENQELTREQKNGQKELMKGFMNDYCQAVKALAASRSLLI